MVNESAQRRGRLQPRAWSAWLFAACLLPALPAHGSANIQLPDMGTSSQTTISPEQEAEYGREVVRSLYRAGRIVEDPLLEEYINDLGYRLASASADAGSGYTFFVLDEPSINAFALPGGYIGVNSGLIIAARSESELASVIAHEIAHVTQQHIARGLEKVNEMNVPVTAALLAAIVLGSQDPQLGQAAIAGSIAGATQARLDFTRNHEQEADRVGMQMLAQAGFDPEGMPSFFERLYQETRYLGAESEQLEFLRTHPVTVSRISDARNRAQQHLPSMLSRKPPDLRYDLVKAELRVRISHDPLAVAQYFQETADKGADPRVVHYGMALAYAKAGKIERAREEIAKSRDGEQKRIAVIRAEAAIEKAAGATEKAARLYREGLLLYPGNGALTLDYARLLLDRKEFDDAANLLHLFLRNSPSSPLGFKLLAEAEFARDNPTPAHLALAEHYALRDEIPLAIKQLELARREPKADFYNLSRIEARLNQLRGQTPLH